MKRKKWKPHEILVAAMATSGAAGLGLPMLLKADALMKYRPGPFVGNMSAKEQPLIPGLESTRNERKVANIPDNKREQKVAQVMAEFLEKKPGVVIAAKGDLVEVQKAWDNYLDESGYRAFDSELRGALGNTAADESIRRLLVLNRMGMNQALNDMRFVDHSYDLLLKNPEQTLSAVKNAFGSMTGDGYSMERNYLIHIAVRMAEQPDATGSSQRIVIDELEKMPVETRTVFKQIYPDYFTKAEAAGYKLTLAAPSPVDEE